MITPREVMMIIVRTVAAEHGVALDEMLGDCRRQKVYRARMAAALQLRALGHSSTRIGRCLNKDHTTILYYLGRLKKRLPAKPYWHRPRITLLEKIDRPQPQPPHRHHLVPYVGADRSYQWKERRCD